jgi:signal transduction histidine kinase
MAGGDVAARVAASGHGDEIDRTAQAFNRMAREVGEQQGQLESRVMAALDRIKKAERHLVIAQRLAATGKLASGIAHEINNPLGGLRNAVRALARGDLDAAKTAEYLALVQDGLARLEDTVKKVLAFTPRSVRPRRTDLADVTRKAIALAMHRLERKGIALVESIPADGRVQVFGDPHELQQVALNLILNAADAIPERPAAAGAGGPGRVEVEVRGDGDTVLLRVTDDGIGMSPEVQAQAFDLFFTTKEVGEGTGLGLAVVHNIVSNHGGRIEVESAPGQGATFRVFLPREPLAEVEAPPAREPVAPPSPEGLAP